MFSLKADSLVWSKAYNWSIRFYWWQVNLIIMIYSCLQRHRSKWYQFKIANRFLRRVGYYFQPLLNIIAQQMWTRSHFVFYSNKCRWVSSSYKTDSIASFICSESGSTWLEKCLTTFPCWLMRYLLKFQPGSSLCVLISLNTGLALAPFT